LLVVVYGASVAAVVIGGVLLGLFVRRAAARTADVHASHREAFALDRGIAVLDRLRGLGFEVACQSLVFGMQGLHFLGLLPSLRRDERRTPVLVLPGYTEDSGAMWWTARGLALRGHNPVLVDFPSTFAPIERNVDFLAGRIAEMRARYDGRPVLVLAHSMGGLIARALLHERSDHGIAALVAIASPFQGTPTARLGAAFGLGASVRQMQPGSDLLRRYPPELGCPVPTLCAVARQEHIVMPEWTATVAGAQFEVVPEAYGHTAPLLLSSVLDRAAAFLAAHDPALTASRVPGP